MKELSIEEKAKRYDKAIERAKEMIKAMTNIGGVAKVDDIQYLFPELKESEDKKIKEWLIRLINTAGYRELDTDKMPCSRTNVVAWLEKQGENSQNPYSGVSFVYNGHTWGMCARDNGVEILIDGHLKGRVFTNDSNAKVMFIKALERVEEQNSKGYKLTECDKNSWWEDFKAYCGYIEMQKSDWSKEDKAWLNDIINDAEQGAELDNQQIDWLKSLRPHNTWKPSDEQIEILEMVLTNESMDDNIARILRELREQLKKLKS